MRKAPVGPRCHGFLDVMQVGTADVVLEEVEIAVVVHLEDAGCKRLAVPSAAHLA
jgi:hypothetical protein